MDVFTTPLLKGRYTFGEVMGLPFYEEIVTHCAISSLKQNWTLKQVQ